MLKLPSPEASPVPSIHAIAIAVAIAVAVVVTVVVTVVTPESRSLGRSDDSDDSDDFFMFEISEFLSLSSCPLGIWVRRGGGRRYSVPMRDQYISNFLNVKSN
ncbi:MAG: hypothetical protein H6962_07945 [Chromatiaceae bacterium]|nr:hypothetical protein [Chromatiaceae bacterium]